MTTTKFSRLYLFVSKFVGDGNGRLPSIFVNHILCCVLVYFYFDEIEHMFHNLVLVKENYHEKSYCY